MVCDVNYSNDKVLYKKLVFLGEEVNCIVLPLRKKYHVHRINGSASETSSAYKKVYCMDR